MPDVRTGYSRPVPEGSEPGEREPDQDRYVRDLMDRASMALRSWHEAFPSEVDDEDDALYEELCRAARQPSTSEGPETADILSPEQLEALAETIERWTARGRVGGTLWPDDLRATAEEMRRLRERERGVRELESTKRLLRSNREER